MSKILKIVIITLLLATITAAALGELKRYGAVPVFGYSAIILGLSFVCCIGVIVLNTRTYTNFLDSFFNSWKWCAGISVISFLYIGYHGKNQREKETEKLMAIEHARDSVIKLHEDEIHRYKKIDDSIKRQHQDIMDYINKHQKK